MDTNKRISSAATSRRELHVIDIENLIGGPVVSELDVARIRSAYDEIVVPAGTAHMVIGASHSVAIATAGFGWPTAGRRVFRHGTDGADVALLEVLNGENVADRFEKVVIASGDGIFAMTARRLVAAGCEVQVVGRSGRTNKALLSAASSVLFIDQLPLGDDTAVAA